MFLTAPFLISGASSINRKEWAAKGEAMVEQYQANAEKRHESKDTAEDLLVGHTTT